MLGDQALALKRRRALAPLRHLPLPFGLPGGVARLVGGGPGRVDLRQAPGQRGADLRQALGVELEVRVAFGVHVALVPADVLALADQFDLLGGVEHAGRTVAHGGVAGALLQHGQPADFERGAGAHRQLRPAQRGDQRRPGLDVVRVLPRVGGADDVRLGREHAGERRPLRLAGEHLQRRGLAETGAGAHPQGAGSDQPDSEFLRNCAHHGLRN